MLRSLYCCMLRLHPPGFRRRFSGEMLLIFDHAATTGSSFKLFLDAFLSLARQWTLRREFWHGRTASALPAADGVPSFLTLDPFRPRTTAVIQGIVLSTVVFAATCFAIRYSWIHLLHVRIPEGQFQPQPQAERENGTEVPASVGAKGTGLSRVRAARGAGSPEAVTVGAEGNQFGAGNPTFRAAATRPSAPGSRAQTSSADQNTAGKTGRPSSNGSIGGDTPAEGVTPFAWQSQSNSQKDVVGVARAEREAEGQGSSSDEREAERTALDAGERHRVIESAISSLEEHYIDPAAAREMAISLRAHEKNGDDGAATDGDSFARLLTSQLRSVKRDLHLEVMYSQTPLPVLRDEPTPEELVQYRKAMRERNCDFEKVQILPRNIGYLKLNSFPDLSICGSTVASAMASLNGADAVIFDLRDNRGGQPETVARMAAYLFDHPEYWYSPRENTTRQSWTQSPVTGNKLADKPVYVLTSHSTYSGAEQFCYDLKMLKRATLIGETTGGGAHAGVFYRIDDHFGIGIPEVRPINPYASPDWAETGVEPDVRVNAAGALQRAMSLAENKLHQK